MRGIWDEVYGMRYMKCVKCAKRRYVLFLYSLMIEYWMVQRSMAKD